VHNCIQNLININRRVYLKYAFDFAKECHEQKGVALVVPFEPVAADVWARHGALSDAIDGHTYARILAPLVAQCGFNMLVDSSANATVLNDILNLVEDRNEKDDDWMPALVELLISFLVDDSRKTRELVLGCFKQISQKLDGASIQIIADAVDPDKDAVLGVEEHEDVDDGVDSDDNDDRQQEEDSESEEEDEEDESEDEGIGATTETDADLEELKKKTCNRNGRESRGNAKR